MDKKHTIFSKAISYALRHRPDKFGLELDNDGYVPTDLLIDGINAHGDLKWKLLIGDIDTIIDESDKQRFEFSSDRKRIRARYGHSVKDKKVSLGVATPPDILYHGTTHQAIGRILNEGLKPMNRQYVHLSDDSPTAIAVGSRRDSNPIILQIDSRQMHRDGFIFGTGNDHTWLVDSVPSSYIMSYFEMNGL